MAVTETKVVAEQEYMAVVSGCILRHCQQDLLTRWTYNVKESESERL
jgi:hypothetical protein